MPEDDLLFKQLHAVIDHRTTLVCLNAAGQVQPVEEPFDTLNGMLDRPPFHVHCRSIVVPWMSGFVNDIRRDANDELARRPEKQRDPRRTSLAPLPREDVSTSGVPATGGLG